MWNIRFTFVKLTATVIQAEDFILPQLHIRSKQNFFNRRLYRVLLSYPTVHIKELE